MSAVKQALELLLQAATLRDGGRPEARELEDRARSLLSFQVGKEGASDATLRFAAGKLVEVETAAGEFHFAQVAPKLSIFERITLDQVGARVSELVRQLAKP